MTSRSVFTPAMIVAFASMLTTAVVLSAVIRTRGYYLTKLPIHAKQKLHTLPTDYPGWVRAGFDDEMSAEGEEELGTSNYLSRTYRERDPEDRVRVMDVHLAYYTGMIDTVPHVPERCFVAGGWLQTGPPRLLDVPLSLELLVPDSTADPKTHEGTIWMGRSPTTQGRVRLPFGIERLRMRVSPFVSERGDRFFAGYFFIANGGTVPSADDIRLLAFRLEDDYAYYTKVQFTSSTVESPEEFVEVAGLMLDEMLPDIMLRMPDWVEVREGRYPEEALGGDEAGDGT